MSNYDNQVFNSDLDAYKNGGQVRTTSITFSGTVGAGAAYSAVSPVLTLDQTPDIAEILFDNSVMHSGKFKRLPLEQVTLVNETTFGSQLTIVLTIRIVGNTIQLRGDGFNPYSSAVNLQAMTVNFRYIPYEATF